MATRELTIKVTTNGTSYYYALESYIMQCYLTKASSAPTIDGEIEFDGEFDWLSSGFRYRQRSGKENSVEKIENGLKNLGGILIRDTELWASPDIKVQTSTDSIVPNTYKKSTGTRTVGSYMNSMLCEFVDSGPNTAGKTFAVYCQQLIRHYVAACTDETYASIIEAWESCISKTLGATKITYSK